MSGKESIRGYICQTVIAVLESLQNDWKFICIEPDTENDKVDIIWTDENSDEKIYQVKSSVNDFGKTEILNYLLNLYNENSSAISFCIVLIGNSSTQTKQYFKKFKDLELADFNEKYTNLYKIKDKIKVDFYHLDLLTIKGAIISNIDRFLSLNKINVDYFTKELIYGGLISQFMYFSTSGKKVSKSQFENELLSWFKHNYSKHLSKSNSELLLSFYLTGGIDFTDSFSAYCLPGIEKLDYIKKKKKKLFDLYERILKYDIKIEHEKEGVNSVFGDLLKLSDISSFAKSLPQYKNEPVIVSDYDKKDISKKALKVLEIELPYKFFEFGDLTESKNLFTVTPWINNNILLSGTENEKAKKEAYEEFYINLENLYDLLQFWSEIREIYFLPIVLRNESKSYEKGLRIKLFFPKEIRIITPKDFPHPKRIDTLKEFNSTDSLLASWFKHQKDSKVNEFYSKKYLKFIQEFETTYSMFAMDLPSARKSKRVEQFYDILNYLFDFEVFNDNSDFYVLECEVDELSANESISLPSFIFYKSVKDFNIEYEINSKNLSKKIKGVLNVKI